MNNSFTAAFKKIDVEDATLGISFPAHVYYPSAQPEAPFKLGPFPVDVALGAPLAPGVFPLVILSHGSGSLPVLFRTLGQYLARRGFVVAMPEHAFNNRHNNSHENTLENLQNRPRHIRLLADWLFKSDRFKTALIQHQYSIIGHSLGGYTALALAGGKPSSVPNDPAGDRQIEVTPDERVKSIILLAPATVWFYKQSALSGVQVPVLMYTGNEDKLASAAFHGKIVLDGLLPTQVHHIEVPLANHFSYMSPYPDELKNPAIPPSQDLPGFDRLAFLDGMYGEVEGFLKRG